MEYKRIIKGPIVLVVLDGWGIREEREHNAIVLASTPCFDSLSSTYPYTTLQASGEYVGLPIGQMGNSEVGHSTIGAGRVIDQPLVRISKEVISKRAATNDAFVKVFTHVIEHQSKLHIVGLLSPGGVHSHEDHFFALIEKALHAGIANIVLHPFLDGRDTPKTSGMLSLQKLETYISEYPQVQIGSIIGRYYAMDRDTNWDRTEKAFSAIAYGKAGIVVDDGTKPSVLLKHMYTLGMFDEHIEPIVCKKINVNNEIQDKDGVIFTNFRSDRAKQLSSKFAELIEAKNIVFVTMSDYGNEIRAEVAYPNEDISTTLGSVLSDAGLRQTRIAETEKYPHVTYFFNGGKQAPYPGEKDILIPSRKDVKTHDEAPEMRAKEITDEAISALDETDFLFINYANPDMVGHTANEPAIIQAIETVDSELQRLVTKVLSLDGLLIVIADHGNAELMRDPQSHVPHTSHTSNPVPCIVIHQTYRPLLRSSGSLQDIAPTILDLFHIHKPSEMSGISLITT